MKITFERIEEWQNHFHELNHSNLNIVTYEFTHEELNELIFILGNLLYFMHMTNKTGFETKDGENND
mgnify:CR=1 FL=1